jgi:hypothetical protein
MVTHIVKKFAPTETSGRQGGLLAKGPLLGPLPMSFKNRPAARQPAAIVGLVFFWIPIPQQFTMETQAMVISRRCGQRPSQHFRSCPTTVHGTVFP